MTLEMCCAASGDPAAGSMVAESPAATSQDPVPHRAQTNLPRAPPTQYPRRAEVGGPHLGLGPLPASACFLSLSSFLINLLHI